MGGITIDNNIEYDNLADIEQRIDSLLLDYGSTLLNDEKFYGYLLDKTKEIHSARLAYDKNRLNENKSN